LTDDSRPVGEGVDAAPPMGPGGGSMAAAGHPDAGNRDPGDAKHAHDITSLGAIGSGVLTAADIAERGVAVGAAGTAGWEGLSLQDVVRTAAHTNRHSRRFTVIFYFFAAL